MSVAALADAPAQLDGIADLAPMQYWIALGVLVVGVVLGWAVSELNRRLLEGIGVSESIEGTAFERTARDFGTSTVSLIARISGVFILILTVLLAATVAEIDYVAVFWNDVAVFVPKLFVGVLVVIVGVVVGDKVELLVGDRLSDVKLPEAGLIPLLAKYSVFYVATLIALSQVGVATLALVVLLAVYAFGLVFLSAIAFRDLLTSGAAGMYLLLNQPYGIGDEIVIGDHRGIVQEVDVLVTHVENDGEEYIVPNRTVFREGIVRVRD